MPVNSTGHGIIGACAFAGLIALNFSAGIKLIKLWMPSTKLP